MKKICCLTVATICLIISICAAADEHIEIRGTFFGSLAGKIISADLYEQDGDTVAVSSLFPETAVYLDEQTPAGDLLFHLSPLTIRNIELMIKETVSSWIKQANCETCYGAYSGDLFDYASSEQSVSFRLSDFIRFLDSANTNATNDQESQKILMWGVGKLVPQMQVIIGTADPLIYYRNYDDGRYETVLIQNQDMTVMTISADHTGINEERLVLSCRTGGKYWFRDITYSQEQESFSIASEVRSSQESAYQSAAITKPLFKETLSVFANSDSVSMFMYTLNADILTAPLVVTGEISDHQDGTAELFVNICIQGNEKENLQITARKEPLISRVRFSDKQELHFGNPKENTEISLAVLSGTTELATEIIPALPQDYQTLLMRMFTKP